MNILKCKICEKPFQSLGSKICEDCRNETEAALFTIRDYLIKNSQNNTVEAIVKNTGVSEAIILHLMGEGRLELCGGRRPTRLECGICHRSITEGRICEACRNELIVKLSGAVAKPVAGEKSGEQDGRYRTHPDHGR